MPTFEPLSATESIGKDGLFYSSKHDTFAIKKYQGFKQP